MRKALHYSILVSTTLLFLFHAFRLNGQERKIITKEQVESSRAIKPSVSGEKKIIYSQPEQVLNQGKQEKKVIYGRSLDLQEKSNQAPTERKKIIYKEDIDATNPDDNVSEQKDVLIYGKNNNIGLQGDLQSNLLLTPNIPSTGACQQFSGSVSVQNDPTCSLASLGFLNNASFTIHVEDAEACAGVYTINAQPVTGSAPDGSTPVITTITTYIGFPQGDFNFAKAGPGQYKVTITNTNGACQVPQNPIQLTVTIADAPASDACNVLPPQQFSASEDANNSPSCAFGSPSFSNNGKFTIKVTDATSCAGTYTINASPVAGSAPNGGTPALTTITTYIGFPQGNFTFDKAGPGQYEVTITNTNNTCSPAKNPLKLLVTVADAPLSDACNVVPDNQFTASELTNNSPSCAFSSPGFEINGNFTIRVTDATSCAGTYTINASPVAGSAPDGSTPANTTITTYIGFPQGDFNFAKAGPGQYRVTITNTNGSCQPPLNPVQLTVTITDAPASNACNIPAPQQFLASEDANNSPSCAFGSPSFSNNGKFTIKVTDATSCAGTYTINASPVAGSAPNGGTPALTTITTYIGFPQGNFTFDKAGPGQYEVTITNTNNACSPAKNPLKLLVTVADAPISDACNVLPDNQFTAAELGNHSPTCAFNTFGYGNNGNFTIRVTDAVSCAGTYTIHAEPVAGSAPDGSTPANTTITTYIGFPQGDFNFVKAGPGQYKVTITNTNGSCTPLSKTIELTVTIADATPPSVNNVQDLTVCPGEQAGPINFSSPLVGVTYLWTNDNTAIGLAAEGQGPIPAFTATNPGSTPITATITVIPAFENQSCYCTGIPIQFKITVADNLKPVISDLSASPNTLWPPDHKMVDVMVNYVVTDGGSTKNTLSVTSNEPVVDRGSGNFSPDWIILSPNKVQLRSERSGNGSSRIYTITVTSEDECGNITTAKIPVTVPKDNGKHIATINSLNAAISPNPSNNNFELNITSTDTKEKIQMKVVDMNGRVVESSTISAGTRLRLGSGYSQGIYFLHLWQGNNLQVFKLIKIIN